MKKLVPVLTLMLVLLVCSGCIRLQSSTVINDDGSGTATLEFGLSKSVAEALREQAALNPDADGGMGMPDFDDMEREEIAEAVEPYGVKITHFEKIDDETGLGVKMAFSFKDLKGLSAAMAVALEEEGGPGMGIFAAGDGNFVLRQTEYDFSDLPLPEPKAEEAEEDTTPPMDPQSPEMQQKQMEIMGTIMGSLSELDIRIDITVPGDIIETNAPLHEGRVSTWTVNSTNMMSTGQDINPVITFSGKGLKIKPLAE